ncbi:hypothetical protein NP493_312g04012 [Ridgeia piscesae]|uniref:Uncharacterized protein n=1 Tax=Ridgeia piscesae TaxID=27915 RepID=A0AAD9L609_RIDPI|nr:hypothetical protein NP493_312g04012 [Ridgeia piscesae]
MECTTLIWSRPSITHSGWKLAHTKSLTENDSQFSNTILTSCRGITLALSWCTTS